MDPDFDVVHWLHLHKTEIYKQLLFDWQDLHHSDNTVTTLGDIADMLDLTESEADHDDNIAASILLGSTSVLNVKMHLRHLWYVMVWVAQPPDDWTECKQSQRSRLYILKPIIVVVHINGQPYQALPNSDSLSDFISTTLIDQLCLHYGVFESLLNLQLAMSGSCSKVKVTVTAQMDYQDIHKDHTFNIININSYNMILGMPFLYQHQVLLGFNSTQVTVHSNWPLAIHGAQAITIESHTTVILKNQIESYHTKLQCYAKDICKEAVETPLLPLCASNHVISLINEHHIYSWQPSKCPEPLQPLWRI